MHSFSGLRTDHPSIHPTDGWTRPQITSYVELSLLDLTTVYLSVNLPSAATVFLMIWWTLFVHPSVRCDGWVDDLMSSVCRPIYRMRRVYRWSDELFTHPSVGCDGCVDDLMNSFWGFFYRMRWVRWWSDELTFSFYFSISCGNGLMMFVRSSVRQLWRVCLIMCARLSVVTAVFMLQWTLFVCPFVSWWFDELSFMTAVFMLQWTSFFCQSVSCDGCVDDLMNFICLSVCQ